MIRRVERCNSSRPFTCVQVQKHNTAVDHTKERMKDNIKEEISQEHGD